jgi:cell division protein FtsL
MPNYIQIGDKIFLEVDNTTPSVKTAPKTKKPKKSKWLSSFEKWLFTFIIGGLFILYAVTIIKNQWNETTEQGKTNNTIKSTATLKVIKNTKT